MTPSQSRTRGPAPKPRRPGPRKAPSKRSKASSPTRRPSNLLIGVIAGAVALALLTVVGFVLASGDSNDDFATTGQENVPPHVPGADVLAYELSWLGEPPEGATANIVYSDGGEGGQKQLDGQALPWRIEFDRPEAMRLALVAAAPAGTTIASITCRIFLNGDEIVTRTSGAEVWEQVTCDADV